MLSASKGMHMKLKKSPYEGQKIKLEIQPSDIIVPQDMKILEEAIMLNAKRYLIESLKLTEEEALLYLEYKREQVQKNMVINQNLALRISFTLFAGMASISLFTLFQLGVDVHYMSLKILSLAGLGAYLGVAFYNSFLSVALICQKRKNTKELPNFIESAEQIYHQCSNATKRANKQYCLHLR